MTHMMACQFGPLMRMPKPPWIDRLRAMLCRIFDHSVRGNAPDGMNRFASDFGSFVVCKRCGKAWP